MIANYRLALALRYGLMVTRASKVHTPFGVAVQMGKLFGSGLFRQCLATMDALHVYAPELLQAMANVKHPTEVADLQGRRFVVAVETDEGRKLAEGLVKSLTGGDKIKARRMREDFWEFAPSHKLALVTNHKPRVTGTDHAIWRRLRLVPFEVTIPEEEQDKTLPAKLERELPGILAWCVRGCLEWQRRGLDAKAGQKVRVATAAYKAESDQVRFVSGLVLTG